MKMALNNPGCVHVTLQKVALWRPLIRNADVFHERLHEAQRNRLHSLMGSDEEEDQESAQIPGNISVYTV